MHKQCSKCDPVIVFCCCFLSENEQKQTTTTTKQQTGSTMRKKVFCYLKLTILYGSAHRFRPNMLTAGAVSAIVEAFILHVDHFFPGGESLCFCLRVLTPHSVMLPIFWPFVKPHMKSSHCLLFHHLLYKV